MTRSNFSHPVWPLTLSSIPVLHTLPEGGGQPVTPGDEGFLWAAAGPDGGGRKSWTENTRRRGRCHKHTNTQTHKYTHIERAHSRAGQLIWISISFTILASHDHKKKIIERNDYVLHDESTNYSHSVKRTPSKPMYLAPPPEPKQKFQCELSSESRHIASQVAVRLCQYNF